MRTCADSSGTPASLPFKFGERGGCIARIIILEQLPVTSFRLGGRLRRSIDGSSARYHAADIRQQALEVTTLSGERLRPIVDDRTVTRDDADGGNAGQGIGCRQ